MENVGGIRRKGKPGPTELTPVVTYILIALNVAVWLLVQQAGSGDGFLQSLCTFGAIPADITGSSQTGQVLELAPRAVCQVGGLGWLTILTSMFMHGGWMHLIGAAEWGGVALRRTLRQANGVAVVFEDDEVE